MKKCINDPENLVTELLEGYTLAFPDKVKLEGENLVLRTYPKELGKVAIVTLGGTGHEPGLSGFVGAPKPSFFSPRSGRCARMHSIPAVS